MLWHDVFPCLVKEASLRDMQTSISQLGRTTAGMSAGCCVLVPLCEHIPNVGRVTGKFPKTRCDVHVPLSDRIPYVGCVRGKFSENTRKTTAGMSAGCNVQVSLSAAHPMLWEHPMRQDV